MKNSDDQVKADGGEAGRHTTLQDWRSWPGIVQELRATAVGPLMSRQGAIVAVECSNRVNAGTLLAYLRSALPDAVVLDCRRTFKIQTLIDSLIAPWLEPRCPGTLCPLSMKQFLDADRLEAFTKVLAEHSGLTLVVGPGASCCCRPDVLVYADNAGEINENDAHPSDYSISTACADLDSRQRVKRRRLIDTPVARNLAQETRPHWNYFLNVGQPGPPVMVATAELWPVIKVLVGKPFIWQPSVHTNELKDSHWSYQPAPYGSVDIPTANGKLPITVDHLFSNEGQSLLGAPGAALRRFTGLCPGEILLQVATEDICGCGMDGKESPAIPDFIAHEHIATDHPVKFHTHGSMHVLYAADHPMHIEYWTTGSVKGRNLPPDGNLKTKTGEAAIIPASVEVFRLNPKPDPSPNGGPILYRWAFGAADRHRLVPEG